MLSYKQWKSLNESILPSFNLGVANPTNMGLQSLFQTLEEAKKKAKKKMAEEDDDAETGDGEVVEPSSEKDEPKEDDMDIDVEEGEDDEEGCDKCGRMSKKKSKKKCGADMNPLEGDGYDDEEEDKEEEMPEEDEDEESEEEDEESEDEDEGEGMSKMMMSKKKMSKDGEELKGNQHKLDKNKNGKIDAQDFKMMGNKKNSKKKMKESTEEEAWWDSVKSMIGPVGQKFDDGCNDGFQMIRTKQ